MSARSCIEEEALSWPGAGGDSSRVRGREGAAIGQRIKGHFLINEERFLARVQELPEAVTQFRQE